MTKSCTPSEVIDLSIKLLDLEVKPLSETSGVSESQISRYRKGKADIGSQSFMRLVRALPDKVKRLVLESLDKDITLEELIYALKD